ncbi:S8 family serine peptidase [Bacteroides pyogenes]|uniref:S8 family serine peptidase n=1 Tax=Bacteroides pyogenes TaxID=310300 RepID=UPI00389A50B2
MQQKLADRFYFAVNNGAFVISNSWHSPSQQAIIANAIQNAITNGRGGKGCVVVFASGNSFSSTVNYPTNSIPDIIAVGSIHKSGRKTN